MQPTTQPRCASATAAMPDTCQANVQYLSADDLAETGVLRISLPLAGGAGGGPVSQRRTGPPPSALRRRSGVLLLARNRRRAKRGTAVPGGGNNAAHRGPGQGAGLEQSQQPGRSPRAIRKRCSACCRVELQEVHDRAAGRPEPRPSGRHERRRLAGRCSSAATAGDWTDKAKTGDGPQARGPRPRRAARRASRLWPTPDRARGRARRSAAKASEIGRGDRRSSKPSWPRPTPGSPRRASARRRAPAAESGGDAQRADHGPGCDARAAGSTSPPRRARSRRRPRSTPRSSNCAATPRSTKSWRR